MNTFLKKLSLCILLAFPPFTVMAHGDAHDAASQHEGLTWPPQPIGITDVVDHSENENALRSASMSTSRIDSLEAIAKTSAKRALGNRFTRVGLIDKLDEKSGNVVSSTLVFFSHDKNTTVEVEFANDKFRSVKSTPAAKYQPEITDAEAELAQQMARNYFIKKGNTNINNLNAYSILAYKPEGAGFYDARVIYVTFHDNDDSPPELMAWVDLTHQRVIKAREEQ